MKLKITTLVKQDYLAVWDRFDEKLFKNLNPPFPPVKLLRFDGSEKGDRVILELNFIVFKQEWESSIIENQKSEQEIYFIDKGVRLPFFLKSWQHKHRIIKSDKGAIISDEITYSAPSHLMTLLLYPVLWLQFIYRKPVYQTFFT
ncbi:SRPBCC family protein [Chondrinema litorale]|uniref:SRPBCC family protein n=1 Tax=Chondrinema litorale TaxID=2994555 RepID=UPI002543F8B1|nr:hypothetical protein [Chondrinema litorale]UZR93500.1 hypothetical protein OQ292_16735 [Chondrinema litorale]